MLSCQRLNFRSFIRMTQRARVAKKPPYMWPELKSGPLPITFHIPNAMNNVLELSQPRGRNYDLKQSHLWFESQRLHYVSETQLLSGNGTEAVRKVLRLFSGLHRRLKKNVLEFVRGKIWNPFIFLAQFCSFSYGI